MYRTGLQLIVGLIAGLAAGCSYDFDAYRPDSTGTALEGGLGGGSTEGGAGSGSETSTGGSVGNTGGSGNSGAAGASGGSSAGGAGSGGSSAAGGSGGSSASGGSGGTGGSSASGGSGGTGGNTGGAAGSAGAGGNTGGAAGGGGAAGAGGAAGSSATFACDTQQCNVGDMCCAYYSAPWQCEGPASACAFGQDLFCSSASDCPGGMECCAWAHQTRTDVYGGSTCKASCGQDDKVLCTVAGDPCPNGLTCMADALIQGYKSCQ